MEGTRRVRSFTPADADTRTAVAAMEDRKPAPATAKAPDLQQPRQPAGDGSIVVSGELKQWHKVTLTLDGPFARERDTKPNPFRDVMINVTFTHESGSPRYFVPLYFAADGEAARTGAQEGTKWRAHLSPDKPGRWD